MSSKDNKTKSPSEDFASFVDSMTAALEASTSAAAQFPDKSDIDFQRSIDRKFGRELDSTSGRVLKLTDRLLQLSVDSQNARSKTQGKGRTFRRQQLTEEDDVVDAYHKTVVEPVEALLEDADNNLDELNGQKKKAAIDIDARAAARATKKLPGPQYEDQPWRNDTSVAKPQLQFKDKIDNSSDAPPWRPTLTEKPHAMVPLGFIIRSDEDSPLFISPDSTRDKAIREREERAFLHPYYYETRHLSYPTSMFTEATPVKPKDFEETPFEFVDTAAQLEALTEELLKAKEIAVDLEYHQTHSYYGFICLMQISTREKDWVIDTLALRHLLREKKLGHVLADPSIVKVFHGSDSDILWLQQDFDIYVVNLFDTYHACKVLEFPKFSLASLLEAYCDFNADKKYQMADWRMRPIPSEMMQYARSDTHFLLYIYDMLRNALLVRSSRTPTPEVGEGDAGAAKPNPQRAIREVLNRSAETALKVYKREGYDREKGIGMNGWANLARKHYKNGKLEGPEGAVFRALHEFRDTLARKLDESPHEVLANFALIKLAGIAPTDPTQFPKWCVSKSPLIRYHIEEICTAVRNALSSCEGKTGGLAPARAGPSKPSATAAVFVPQSSSLGSAHKRFKTDPSAVADVWKDLDNRTTSAGNTQPRSALFGATMAPAPARAQYAVRQSSMFGDQRGQRQASPGFAAIQSSIHSAFAPSEPPTESPVEVAKTQSKALNPETVAFVPADQRKTPASTSTSTSKAAKASDAAASSAPSKQDSSSASSPAVAASTDEVVQVKKKKGSKAKKAKGVEAVQSGAESSGATTPVGGDAADDKATASSGKLKKAARAKQDIPEFSYSNEPNLLDQPKSSTQSKKKAKPKKDPAAKKPGLDTSSFPRAPQNQAEPKSGSKSGTFAS